MREETITAAVAGLLHDLGKFAQRAGISPSQTWDAEAQLDYRYKHAILSGEIAENLLGRDWAEALQAITYHHRPEHPAAGRMARVVALADRLSSGERVPSDEAQPQRLLSIFGRLFSDSGEPPSEAQYLPLRPLRVDRETLFAEQSAELVDSHDQYEALWSRFTASLALSATDHGEGIISVLLQQLQRYTWAIPSAAWRSIPDVSLYDHSRMTAALSTCLETLDDATNRQMLEHPDRHAETVAVLVGGDVSGIQEFLYTITPRGATPALRGRSFYLQLLTEAVADYVLRELGLPACNLIYVGGGHFYLLAPPGADRGLLPIQRAVSRILLRHHGGDLYLALAAQPLAAADFFGGNLSTAWERMEGGLRTVKDRRFSELQEEMYALLFQPDRDEGNRERECQVCHREHADTSIHDGWAKCPMCLSFESLGDDLRHAQYLQIESVEPDARDLDAAGRASDVLAALGRRVTLHNTLPPDARHPRPGITYYALTDDALDQAERATGRAFPRKLFVSVTPEADGRVASHDELARASRGIDRLGILRMDVDDLGHVFREGLGRDASLSRIATLSMAMSLFFEGYVETLAGKMNGKDGQDRVYSIYSGGDDLFFVGAWDAMVDLARQVSSEFAAYTGRHDRIHISGGLVLVDGHYPLYRAAEEARTAEEAAKQSPGKDSFTFLGKTVKWDTFDRVAELATNLSDMVSSASAPRSLLRLLIRAEADYDAVMTQSTQEAARYAADGAAQGYYGPWIPRLEYALKRMAERHKGIATELEDLSRGLREDRYRSISWIGLAARWAELLNRMPKGARE